ncbi:MAG: hypothetical protein JNL74_04755 [Fibrobacteres bacterium]|nr:hypothetical protein [Fibrobacterota bacterium]
MFVKSTHYVIIVLSIIILTVNCYAGERREATALDTSYRLMNIAFESFVDNVGKNDLKTAESYLDYMVCSDPMNILVGRLSIVFGFIKRDRASALAAVDTFMLYHRFNLLLNPIQMPLRGLLQERIKIWDIDGGITSPNDDLFLKGLINILAGNYRQAGIIWGGILSTTPDYKRLQELKNLRESNESTMRMALFYDLYLPQRELSNYFSHLRGGGFSIGKRLGYLIVEGSFAGFGAEATNHLFVDRKDGRIDTMFSTFGGNISLSLRGTLQETAKHSLELILSASYWGFELAPDDSTPAKFYESVSSSYFAPTAGLAWSWKKGKTGNTRLGIEAHYSPLRGGSQIGGLEKAAFFQIRFNAAILGNTRNNNQQKFVNPAVDIITDIAIGAVR